MLDPKVHQHGAFSSIHSNVELDGIFFSNQTRISRAGPSATIRPSSKKPIRSAMGMAKGHSLVTVRILARAFS
jgi:hypothetical protein